MAPCAAKTLRKRFPGPRACSCEARLPTERAGASSAFDFFSSLRFSWLSSSELLRRSRVRLTAEPRFSSEASLAVRALARFLGRASSSADSSGLRLGLFDFEGMELSRERDLATTLRSRLGGEASFSSRRRRSVFSFLPLRGTSLGSLRPSCLVFFFFFFTSSSEDPLSLAFDLLDTTFLTLTLALSARELAALLVFSRRRLLPSLFFFLSSFFDSSFFESFFDSFFFTGGGDGDGDSAPEPLEASELVEEGSGAFDFVELRAGGAGVDF